MSSEQLVLWLILIGDRLCTAFSKVSAQSDFRTNLSHNHHQQVFLRGVKSIYQNKLALQGAAIIFGFTKGIFLLQRLWIPFQTPCRVGIIFFKYEYISKNCQIVNILQTSWRTEGRVWMTDFKEVSVEVHNVAFKVSFRRKKVKFKWKSIPPTCLQRKDKSRIQIAQMAWHET